VAEPHFKLFYSCVLDPMTFIHKLEPYPLKMYLKAKHELSRSMLSKVIVLQSKDIQMNQGW